MNRRHFLKQAFVGSLTLTAYSAGVGGRAQAGPKGPRRHCINFAKGGGIDQFWMASSMAPSQLRSGAHPALESGGAAAGSLQIQRVGPSMATDYLTLREAENPAQFYTSQGRSHYFGMGFHQLFRNTHFDSGAELLSKMCVWKGMSSPCRHELDNPVLQHGVASSYALSFTALVSQRLAMNSARTLHYVVLADNPSAAYLNFAMNTDFASPSCIPGIPGLAALTGRDPNDFNLKSRRDLIANAVRNLSGNILSSRLKLKSSLSSLGVFSNSFQASATVAGSFLDQDIELLYLRNRFLNSAYAGTCTYFGISQNGGSGEMYTALSALPANGGSGLGSGNDYISSLRTGLVYLTSHPLPDLTSYRSRKRSGLDTTSDEAILRPLLTANINSLQRLYPGLVDKFALSAYLVIQNLSAVVDFRDGAGMDIIDDAHHTVLPSRVKEMAFFSCYRELMLALDEVKDAEGVMPGETLLDATHIVMHTEMDRTAGVLDNTLGVTGGTNHSSSSTTVLMAGYGIHGGSVIGDLHKGVNDGNEFGGNFTSALPINTSTGLPSAGGSLVTLQSLAPTLVEMFDAKLPPQQISAFGFVSAVIKKRMT